MNEENSFLGKGWSFPPTFDNASGEVQMLRAKTISKAALRVLLATKLGRKSDATPFSDAISMQWFLNYWIPR
jgi:hypothetical protein